MANGIGSKIAKDVMKRVLSINWVDNRLTIRGIGMPDCEITVDYLEAFCRSGSTDRNWDQTVIGHSTELIGKSSDERVLTLRSTLKDGVIVNHILTVGKDEVDFRLTACNPTQAFSDAQWAQPCIQLDVFTGSDRDAYTKKCFVFIDGKLCRLPTVPWATEARYVPGQVWCPRHVSRQDVNPRPLSSLVPSNGLIGAFAADEKLIVATAWEPYQELFQGIRCCIHSDFRIGGLKPGESKKIRGKIYIVEADIDALGKRYEQDFPEHVLAFRADTRS